jgi:hypothetical protein
MHWKLITVLQTIQWILYNSRLKFFLLISFYQNRSAYYTQSNAVLMFLHIYERRIKLSCRESSKYGAGAKISGYARQ